MDPPGRIFVEEEKSISRRGPRAGGNPPPYSEEGNKTAQQGWPVVGSTHTQNGRRKKKILCLKQNTIKLSWFHTKISGDQRPRHETKAWRGQPRDLAWPAPGPWRGQPRDLAWPAPGPCVASRGCCVSGLRDSETECVHDNMINKHHKKMMKEKIVSNKLYYVLSLRKWC